MRFHRTFVSAVLSIMLLAVAARAEDLYVSIPINKLPIEGKLPQAGEHTSYGRLELYPRITLQTPGAEAFLKLGGENNSNWWSVRDVYENSHITFKIPASQDLSGRLVLPDPELKSQVAFTFKLSAAELVSSNDAKSDFLHAKHQYYSRLAQADVPGAAWFRHQERAMEKQLELKPRSERGSFRGSDDDEFAILSGGRAIAENLQLDRVLVARSSDKPAVDIATLEGVTVKKFDWKPLLKDANPELDPLASLIPHDQHALFFPSTQAFVTFIAEAGRSTLPVLEYMTESGTQDERLADRYSRQLCLPLAELDKKLPAGLIASIAVTGSDPSLRTGSAVAILLESPKPDALMAELEKIVNAQAAGLATPSSPPGDSQWMNEDRSISVRITLLEKAVLVTNSWQQHDVITRVQSKGSPSLASLDEYRYFRTRYPRNHQKETAFLIITDDALRRWCGPKLRIAEAHRIRAAAILADLECMLLENPVYPILENLPPGHDLGTVTIVNGHMHSSRYNTLGFLTPAEELELKQVPAADAESYKRWRDTYQQNWRNYFDPIALSLSLEKSTLAADLTVAPLIERSTYNSGFFSYFNGKFAPGDADPHDTLFQLVLGIDISKPPLSELLPNMLGTRGIEKMVEKNASPFGWLGNNVSLYIDPDPIWQEFAKTDPKKYEEFFMQNVSKFPIAIRLSSKNPLAQVAFLATLRSFVETSAPGMLQYTVLTHQNQPYVRVTGADQQLFDMKDFAIYYLSTSDALVVSINEPLIKRAIERRPAATRPATQPDSSKWLGQTIAAHLDMQLIRPFIGMGIGDEPGFAAKAWAPLPILNDLKRLRPKEDALELYTKTFHQVPVDPLGGTYAWDEKLQTYASSTLGSPLAPKSSSKLPPAIESLKSVDFGITLDEKNLRARAVIHRTP